MRAVVDVDWMGVRRCAGALGGEGTVILRLRTDAEVDEQVLDAALPPDEGDSPANGGWFAGPGGFLLLAEGLRAEVDPWIEQLAAGLDDAGFEGTLTGASVVGNPRWAQRVDREAVSFVAVLGYRPRPGVGYYDGWLPDAEVLDRALGLGMGWLTAHGARVMALADLRARFWVDATTARRVMRTDLQRRSIALSSGYDKHRSELRHVSVARRGLVSLTSRGLRPWRETVDELRAALTTAPLEGLAIAMVTPHDFSGLRLPKYSGAADGRAYDYHPERWAEFTLDPCGIQILTDQHLAAATDLTSWVTTRLDHDHHLVEARDLAPWYEPVAARRPVAPDVLDQARRDFGEAILTYDRAERLGLNTKPPRPR
ncbi:hypothetical protein JQN72_16910 [Phycicoccus sp. CSK15P-2]|uniref:hypothetical protein n=1 Tax=Phycicoccus sp. CSK15P-2 TaxID=2807627 RepID=UPI001950ACF1|nr:hypothetical protein [Phycicoccus sp. CSK15P-2]MBM6405924.1 hypothetical protein [Phycicoccus sp. CSK15P-2]